MQQKPLLVHFHFHHRRTGVTRSIENVLPGLQHFFRVFIFGYGITGPAIQLRKVIRLILAKEYFIIHVHRNNEMLLALMFRWMGGNFKLVATRHAESKPSGFTLWLLQKADEVIALTASMSAHLPLPSTVIGHGVDTNWFLPSHFVGMKSVPQKNIISVIGRVRKAKGQHIFLEAVAPVLKNNSAWAAVIVGKTDDQGYLKKLQTLVDDNQISNQVYFLDETADILPVYQASKVVVVPSFSEGFSLVCLEAMACGCVVVATQRVGVHSDLIRHQQTGYLFQRGDVSELKLILENLTNEDRSAMVEKARLTIVSEWDVLKEASKLSEVYLTGVVQ